jgi:hypothetical protein
MLPHLVLGSNVSRVFTCSHQLRWLCLCLECVSFQMQIFNVSVSFVAIAEMMTFCWLHNCYGSHDFVYCIVASTVL